MNCKTCSAEMKLIPAGLSKRTGKEYDAFYSCKSCNVTAPAGNTSPEPQNPVKTQPSANNGNVERIIKAIEESREDILSELQTVMDFRVKMFDKLDEILVAIEKLNKN